MPSEVPGNRTRRHGLLSTTAAVANPPTIRCSDPARLQWTITLLFVHYLKAAYRAWRARMREAAEQTTQMTDASKLANRIDQSQ
jgi:hypothetical protein